MKKLLWFVGGFALFPFVEVMAYILLDHQHRIVRGPRG